MDFGAIFYPTFLVCFLFGIILATGIGFSYLWLVMFDKQARKCPDCHKLGGGDITASELIASKQYMDFKRQPPVQVTEKTYEDHYQCQHCGHTWTKIGQETLHKRVKP
jgi:hypothetical protein